MDKITKEMELTCQTGVSELLQKLFENKREVLVTQEIRKMIELKTQTIQQQTRILSLKLFFCRICGDMTTFGGYSTRIAQIDDEIEEKLKFRFRLKSTNSLLVSRFNMTDMRCFSNGGMTTQHDAIYSHVARRKKS